MSQLNLFQFFKASSKSPQVALPSPNGPLSREIPSTAICEANKEVEKTLKNEDTKKRGCYQRYDGKQKAAIGNYALVHGTSVALRHYLSQFPNLKYTTICEWKTAVAGELKKDPHQPVMELHGKKRGRPSTFPDEIVTCIKKYIRAVRDAGGVINTAIVIGAASGIVRRMRPDLLECNGGHVTLPVKKDWAKYLLGKMSFVKRKATTKKSKISVANFGEIKDNFLIDIKAIATLEDVPNEMILNWDQTAIKYIPVSNWTMATEGSKRVELIGQDDKRQITATFAGTLAGDFLPIELVYEGKTSKCHPSVSFPEGWHVTHTANHWCNEDTMIDYIKLVIAPYMDDMRKKLGLSPTHTGLVILDEFKGQTTPQVLKLLEEHHLMYVIVPPNCTDRLQPLDVSVNRAAKHFMRTKFESWYADRIMAQQDYGQDIEPVDLRLSVVKPIGAQWMVELYEYLKGHPNIIINGFKSVGILDSLAC